MLKPAKRVLRKLKFLSRKIPISNLKSVAPNFVKEKDQLQEGFLS